MYKWGTYKMIHSTEIRLSPIKVIIMMMRMTHKDEYQETILIS